MHNDVMVKLNFEVLENMKKFIIFLAKLVNLCCNLKIINKYKF